MKHLLLLLLSVTAFSGQAQSLAGRRKMDDKYGFRDVRLETDSAALAGRTHAFDLGVQHFYERPTDDLHIGTAKLTHIYYVFVAGKLAQIVLNTDGTADFDAVYEAYKAEYGPSFLLYGYTGSGWQSATELISLEDGPGYKRIIRIISKPMEKVVRAATKQAAKKASSDL